MQVKDIKLDLIHTDMTCRFFLYLIGWKDGGGWLVTDRNRNDVEDDEKGYNGV